MENRIIKRVCVRLLLLQIFVTTLCASVSALVATDGCKVTGGGTRHKIYVSSTLSETGAGELGCASFNDSTVSCSDLQSAIDWTMNTASCFAEIFLPNGKHSISQQADLQNASLHLVGEGDNVIVQCDYFADPNLNGSRDIHTWYFEASDSVAFENVHFIKCGFPIRLDVVRHVLINSCTFRYFTEAAVDIYNCKNVTITNTIVEHNSGTGRLIESFRGNSGGVAIGYNTLPDDYFDPTVRISNCTFQNNQANGFRTPNRAVAANVYLGRGGGIGLFLNESLHNLTLTISDCLFQGNTARLFGGGLFILTQSHRNNQMNILVERSSFIGNNVSYGGAGVQLSYLNSGENSRPHTVVFRECNFVHNRGPSGSGIYIFVGDDGNLAKLEGCNFTGNTGLGSQLDFGAAVALSFLSVFRQRVISPRHEITDCYFSGNSGPNGIVSIGYAPAIFRGTTHFLNNQGASLRIVGSVVDFEGETTFTDNSVTQFGALQLLSFAQIRLMGGCRMKFSGNVGSLGASIVVDSPASLSAFSDLLFNPKCFLLYEDKTAPPSEWGDVNVTFVGNQAVVASSVYLSQTDSCSWFTDIPPYFNNTHIPDWPIWKNIDNINVGHENPLDQQFTFGTAPEKLSTEIDRFIAWPGQKVSIPLQGLDNFNHPTSVNARFFFNSHEHSSQSAVRFDPEIVVIAGRAEVPGEQELLQKEFLLTYTIANASVIPAMGEPVGRIGMEEPFNSYLVESDSFELVPLPCPAGYSLNPVSPGNSIDSMQYCTCLDSADVVTCEDDQDNIIIKVYRSSLAYVSSHFLFCMADEGLYSVYKTPSRLYSSSLIQNDLWAEYVPSQMPNLFFYPCPPGYCRCFQNTSLGSTSCASVYSHSFPNLQCKCNRKGILCGSCINNTGVSALLNECVTCSDAFGTLIGVLIVLDVIALVTVTLFDKPLPMWAYPFLFYVQMAPYASESFAPGFEAVGKYLYFINSGTSFYFIYDFCLHSALNPLISYFLRYLPLFTALIVFPVMWLIRRHYRKRWKSLRKHGFWWIIVLIYSHTVHTSMSILNCPFIPDSNGHRVPRWYLDGNIQCFTGGHIPLALLAILILFLCVLSIPTLVVLTIKRPQRIQNWVDPLKTGYREEVKWWSGVELGRRLLFLLFIISFPKNTVYGMLVLVVSIITYSYILPYKSKAANAIEIIVQLNFLTLLVLEATPLFQDTLFVFPTPSKEESDRSRVECLDSPMSASHLTWLLLPFYYLPVLGLMAAAVIYGVLYLRKKVMKYKTSEAEEEDPYIRRAVNVTTQVLEIDPTIEEGVIELHDTLTESSTSDRDN